MDNILYSKYEAILNTIASLFDNPQQPVPVPAGWVGWSFLNIVQNDDGTIELPDESVTMSLRFINRIESVGGATLAPENYRIIEFFAANGIFVEPVTILGTQRLVFPFPVFNEEVDDDTGDSSDEYCGDM